MRCKQTVSRAGKNDKTEFALFGRSFTKVYTFQPWQHQQLKMQIGYDTFYTFSNNKNKSDTYNAFSKCPK